MVVTALQADSRDLNIFAMIHREVLPVATARAQGRHPEHIGNEFKPASIPSENHWAGAGKPRLLLIRNLLSGRLPYLVLHHPVRPGDPDRVHLRIITQTENQRSV